MSTHARILVSGWVEVPPVRWFWHGVKVQGKGIPIGTFRCAACGSASGAAQGIASTRVVGRGGAGRGLFLTIFSTGTPSRVVKGFVHRGSREPAYSPLAENIADRFGSQDC
jgi:hypothetical protein